jgi:CheY-like chemotaxis protein
MPNTLAPVLPHAAPSPPDPGLVLRGLVLVLVEDSRLSCEALRLIAVRSGARLRRAEGLGAARRLLARVRPDAVIVDLGLPDGRGEELIAECAARGWPVIGTSGAADGWPRARAAGAVAFLDKPMPGLAAVQALILAVTAPAGAPAAPCVAASAAAPVPLAVDPLALRDDLRAALGLIAEGPLPYAMGFVRSLARAAGDPGLALAADRAADWAADPAAAPEGAAALAAALSRRLEGLPAGP